ncbi:MAG: hypothetical protein N2486_03200 [Caloramator sp.]|nr:hypothetical protein [Caloramator sp.]
MRLNRKIDIIKWVSLFIIIIALLVFFIPIPINKTYDAIEIKLDDPSYIVRCQVKIHGKYYKNLFINDAFDGQIAVSDYKLTNEKMRKVYFLKDGCPLEYYHDTGRKDSNGHRIYEEYILGRIYSKSWFRGMTICVYNDNPLNKNVGWKVEGDWGGWDNQHGYCIVPNATSREEALNILSKNKVIP